MATCTMEKEAEMPEDAGCIKLDASVQNGFQKPTRSLESFEYSVHIGRTKHLEFDGSSDRRQQ